MGMNLLSFWGRDVNEDTAYGLAENHNVAADQAYKQVPDKAYDIVEEHEAVTVPHTDVEGINVDGLHLVAVSYKHDPVYDPDLSTDRTPADHPINDLSGVTHPNDELSGVPHPLDGSRR